MSGNLSYLDEPRDNRGRWTSGGLSQADTDAIDAAVHGVFDGMPAKERVRMMPAIQYGGHDALVGVLAAMMRDDGAQAHIVKASLRSAGVNEAAISSLDAAATALRMRRTRDDLKRASAALGDAATAIGPTDFKDKLDNAVETAKAGDGVAASANPTTPAKTYIDPDPGRWLGKESVGTGWCVPLVQKATGAPLTSEWRAGASVFGNPKIKPGTAIAVFDKDGRYGNHTDGTSHAAIFLGQDAGGIHVIDQFNTVEGGKITGHRAPMERDIQLNSTSKDKVDDPRNYNVIISK